MNEKAVGIWFAGIAIAFASCCANSGVRGHAVSAASGEKLICAGHHQMRLPGDAKVRISATYAGLKVSNEGRAQWKDVDTSLRERARHAKDAKSPQTERAASIYRAAGVDPDTVFADSRLVGFDIADGRAFIAEYVGKSPEFTFEAHRLYEGEHFLFGGKHSQASDYDSIRDGASKSIERFTPLSANEIPASTGFCTGNGVFALKGRDDVGGDAQVYVTFPDYPGVKFSLNLYGLVKRNEEPSFLERMGRDLAELLALGGKVRTLHRGAREYAGQKGQLVAVSMPAEDGSDRRAYKYFWHAQGKPLDPFLPEIEAELMTDSDGTSVDADAVEALWEQIMGSLEPRVSGGAKRPAR